MFAVIYQAYIKTGREGEYQQCWHKVALYFKEKCGAIGSCLHRTDDGLWISYSRWPNKATRDKAWPGDNAPSDELPEDIRESIKIIQDCLDTTKKFPEICMEIIDDQLLK